MKPRASVVAMSAVAFALALVLLRPQPSTTVPADGVENAQPPPLASAERDRAAIDPAPIPAAPQPVAPPAPAEALEPTPSAAPLPTGFVPSAVADIIAASGADQFVSEAASLADHEREFAAETADPDWGPRVEGEILSALAQQTGLELTSVQVECRATLCRVQMTKPRRDGPQSNPVEFVKPLGLHPLHIRTAGGRSIEESWVAYISRFRPVPPSPPPPESTSPNPRRTDP